MEFTVKEIANIVHGEIEGNPDLTVNKLSKIENGEPGSLTFLANPKYTNYLYKTNATAVIINRDFVPDADISCTLIKVEDAYSAFASLLEVYNKIKLDKSGISDKSYIHPSAEIGEHVYIAEFAFIGENARIGNNAKIYPHCYVGDNVVIGNNTTLFSGVKVYSDNKIGSNCTLHGGVVIGSDGFGFAPQQDNNYQKVAQIGNVIIEDNVEIGSNTTIDRATLGSTIIRKGVKLDNLIQIAHNVEIGENTVIAAQTGVAGSSRIGRNCMIGGQVGIVGHLTIADNVKIAAQSGITSNITREGVALLGSPAFEVSKYKKSYIHFRNLPTLESRIRELEEIIKELKNK